MTKPKLVLIGNGMAGVRTLEELLEFAPEFYDITVFGAEPWGNYNRILLSPVLAGEKSVDDIMLNDDAWYANRGITLHKGKKVTAIDRARREVVADDGTCASYDHVILATGSTPIALPVPGADLPGVLTFRDLQDVEVMLHCSRRYKRAVVIGGGLLGLEAANGLMKQGMDVTVVHLLDYLMEKQLDRVAAALLQQSLQQRGLKFQMQAETNAIIGQDRVEGVRFADGTELAADLVVMAVGIRPNIDLARQSGLVCERGVLVNDVMQTFDPRIYAVGECVQHRGASYGLVAPLYEQAKVVANQLAEDGYFQYRGSLTATKLKVTGIDLFSAGDFQGDEQSEDIVYQDPARGVYRKLVLRDNRIAGAVLYGDTLDGPWYAKLMKEGADVSGLRESLVFGQGAVNDQSPGAASIVSAPDDTPVCDCNGVCKGTIVQAIRSKGLSTLAEVRAHTKASASCGSCTGLVEQLIEHVAPGYERPAALPMCACTSAGHDEVRRAIVERQLKTASQVRAELGWTTADGCAKCRPALNYYLLCAWPGEAHDDPQSRFINERAHANIQKDGTFSVVPRIWGGVTTPDQLRAIADVADKYSVPTVKITGGQRIDLLGVKKEDLPAMWEDLSRAGFVSGHAYGKAVRTVKTCVGEEWCRFGVQDSTTMGIRMEQMTWGAWAPHKIKMAVSGCPRNCAEATIKDFGVVAVESGWELHVGGNGGMKVRATDVLCRVQTMEEVLEYCGAFLQMYREQAHYLERTAGWIERVGLDTVKARVVLDPGERARLYARFQQAQKVAQVDPWAERAAGPGKEASEFVPLARLHAGKTRAA